MEDTKLWWQSKTIWGAILTTISVILYVLGIGPLMTGDEVAYLSDAVLGLTGSAGMIATVWGRVAAKTQVVLTKPAEPGTTE